LCANDPSPLPSPLSPGERGRNRCPSPVLGTGHARTIIDKEHEQKRGVARDDHLWKNCGESTNCESQASIGFAPTEGRVFGLSWAARWTSGTGISGCEAQTEKSVPPSPPPRALPCMGPRQVLTLADTQRPTQRGVARDDHLWKNCGEFRHSGSRASMGFRCTDGSMFARS
jgi:hypothetical protein